MTLHQQAGSPSLKVARVNARDSHPAHARSGAQQEPGLNRHQEQVSTQATQILIIDGHHDQHESLRSMLDTSYEILIAHDGKAGLDMGLSGDFALILCDLRLPDIDGTELIRRLRTHAATHQTPIVAISLGSNAAETLAAVAAGADDYLTKPFLRSELLLRIQLQIARSRNRERESMRFRDLADEIPHLIWSHDEDGKLQWANRRWHEFTHLGAESTLQPLAWNEIIPHEDFGLFSSIFSQALSAGLMYEVQIRMKAVDAGSDQYRWHLVRGVPLRDSHGQINHWLGTGTDIHDQFTAAAIRERDLEALSEVIPQIVWQMTPDGLNDYFNQHWYEYTGLTSTQSIGRGWTQAIHPEDMPGVSSAWQRALTDDVQYDTEFRLRSRHGHFRWFLTRGRALRDQHGDVVRWFGTCTDIDDRKRSEQLQRFVTDAVAKLGRSSDFGETHQAIVNHAVETVADMCILDIRRPNTAVERISWAHRDNRLRGILHTVMDAPQLASRYQASAMARALERQQPHVMTIQPSEASTALGVSDVWADGAAHLGIASLIAVPILGYEDPIGVITFCRNAISSGFTPDDCIVYHDVGRRLGLAIESAQQSQRNRLVADRFQHAALPKNLPSVPGLSFSGVYRAAKAEALVGGDWYDAFRLADGRIVLSIGDVMGSGLDAAVTMGAVRQTIRGATHIYPDPVTVLNAADRTLRTEQPDRIVTAFVAVFDPLTLHLAYASAGHPPPFLRYIDGSITELSGSGLPLGLRDTNSQSEPTQTMTINTGSLLVLYTDGLTEATRNLDEGEQRVRAALNTEWVLEAQDQAAAIADLALDHVEDDVAILAMRVGNVNISSLSISGPDNEQAHWMFNAHDISTTRQARREISEALRTRGVGEADVVTTELILSELLGNVMRHTDGDTEVAFDLTDTKPVLHVMDAGPGFSFHAKLPNSIMSESGRGLYIASMLALDLSVMPRQNGGSHARVVLPFDLPKNTAKRSPKPLLDR